MERDRCRQDETGQKLDVKKCDGIVRRFTKTGDRRGKIRDGYPCTPETCAKAVIAVGDLGLMGSSGHSPGWLSSTQVMPVIRSLLLGSVPSGDFGCWLSDSFGLVTPGSSWQPILEAVLSTGLSLVGPVETSLPGTRVPAVRFSFLEARTSGKEGFFLQAPAGDCGDCGSSRVFVLVVGEKEARVGLSGNGLGMSRIRCARFDDANLLWKDLGDEQFTTG